MPAFYPDGTLNGTGGGSSSSSMSFDMPGFNPAPQVEAPAAPDIKATISPQLEALSGEANQYLQDIKGGTGHAFDIVGAKMRDAREGGRKALMQANAIAGRPDTQGVASYDAETQRGVEGALTDEALGREQMRGGAIQTATNVARAPIDAALAEKNLGLQAYNSHVAATQTAQAANAANSATAFNQMLALMQARRESTAPAASVPATSSWSSAPAATSAPAAPAAPTYSTSPLGMTPNKVTTGRTSAGFGI